MRATSVKLAEAGEAMQRVVTHPQPHPGDVRELIMAAQARDQALAQLATIQAHLVASPDSSVTTSGPDSLRHPVLGLALRLRQHPPTGLGELSPSDIALQPPAHPAVLAWTQAAAALEGAAVDASRAMAGAQEAARQWAGLPPSAPSPRMWPSPVAWALAADVAALSIVVARADDDLSAALALSDRPGLREAARAIRTIDDDDLKVTAAAVLHLAQSGPLADQYHLASGARGALPVRSAKYMAQGLDRAIDLLTAAPTLTGPQQLALTRALATISHHLAKDAPAPAKPALDELARGLLNYAEQWGTRQFQSRSRGDADVIAQVSNVAGALAREPLPWASAADPTQREQTPAAAQRLVAVATLAVSNVRQGIANGDILTPGPKVPGADPWEPVLLSPRRRLMTTALEQVDLRLDAVRREVGTPSPLTSAQAAPGLSAREVLTSLVQSAVARPENPAAPAVRRMNRLPGAFPSDSRRTQPFPG